MFSVRRSTKYEHNYDADPYLWESDQSTINFTFADFSRSNTWSHETGLSSGFHGYYPEPSGWKTPKPEDGNKMFVNLGYQSQIEKKCPLYCEKSGIFVAIILVTRVYNIP